MKPRLLPFVTIALAILLAVAVFNFFGVRLDDGDGPSYAIGGRTIAADGALPENLWVRISWEEGSGVRSVSVPVQADGSFRAEKLKPGDYRLVPVVRSASDTALDVTPASVTIRDRDVTGIEIRM
jgi:hypothetical protein